MTYFIVISFAFIFFSLNNFRLYLVSPNTIFLSALFLFFCLFPFTEMMFGNNVLYPSSAIYLGITLIGVIFGYVSLNFDFREENYDVRRVAVQLIYFQPIIVMCYVFWMASNVGMTISEILMSPLSFRISSSGGGKAYLYFIFGVLVNWGYLFVWYLYYKNKMPKFILIYFCVFSVVFAYISGSSGFFINLLLIPFLLRCSFYRQPKVFNFVLFLFLLIFLYLFSRVVKNQSFSLPDFGRLWRFIVSRFDAAEKMGVYFQSEWSSLSPTFQSITDFFFFYLPRSVFPEKPFFFQVQASQKLIFLDDNYTEITYSFTGIAEAFHSFGAIGVVLLGFSAGCMLKFANKCFVDGKKNNKYFFIGYWVFGSLPYSLIVDKVVADIFMLPVSFVGMVVAWSFIMRRVK